MLSESANFDNSIFKQNLTEIHEIHQESEKIFFNFMDIPL